jgi:hypothetical protein
VKVDRYAPMGARGRIYAVAVRGRLEPLLPSIGRIELPDQFAGPLGIPPRPRATSRWFHRSRRRCRRTRRSHSRSWRRSGHAFGAAAVVVTAAGHQATEPRATTPDRGKTRLRGTVPYFWPEARALWRDQIDRCR